MDCSSGSSRTPSQNCNDIRLNWVMCRGGGDTDSYIIISLLVYSLLVHTMGHSNSKQKLLEFQSSYFSDGPRHHRFFGPHTLLTKRTNPQQLLIRKEFVFRSGQQFQYVCAEYERLERKPFSLIYPTAMIHSGSLEHCSTVKELYLYFEIVGKPLTQVVRKEGMLSEAKAWFLLNQLSRALQILEQSGRAHWAISPDTVYRNNYQNYLLYDSFFVLGPDPTNFLNTLKDSREPLTEKTQAALDRGLTLSPSEGHQEDMYTLGLTLFFAVTGIHARGLPPFPKKADSINTLLAQRSAFLSDELCRLIKQLTERQPSRRVDNKQLRKLLKEREADIIKRQTVQYQLTHRNSLCGSYGLAKSPTHGHKLQETRRHAFNSPDTSYRPTQPFSHDFSPKLDARGSPKQKQQSPQERSHHESTWQTKKSAVLSNPRHQMAVQKDPSLTRILSYDKLMNRH